MGIILASDKLESSSEERVYEKLVAWMQHASPGLSEVEEAHEVREGEGSQRGEGSHIRGVELLRHLRFPLMDGQYLALEIHQNGGMRDCQLLKSLTTEAALWQIVPAQSKHLFKLQHLTREVLQPRAGSWRFAGIRPYTLNPKS